MTASPLAALALAVAVLVRPGNAIAAARLAAVNSFAPPTTNPYPATQPPQSQADPPSTNASRARRLALPLAAAVGIGLLPVAAVPGAGGLILGATVGVPAFLGCQWLLGRAGTALPGRAGMALPGRADTTLPGRARTALPGWVTGRAQRADPLQLAGGWDLLAACLRGGLPVPVAVRAIADELPLAAAEALRRTAELVALGADPVAAWEPALREPLTAELARGARRSARSGAALAGVAEGLAATIRGEADELAEARAQRVAVAVTGPLGLCFLPAFLCIGVVPVVIGLATRLVAGW